MNAKYLILIGILFLLALTAVSAQDNSTVADDNLKADDENTLSSAENDKLETTYYYDANTDEEYEDDTVVTHNVVKYYGDRDTKFKVKVYDEDYNPEGGVYVSFGKIGNLKDKKTNPDGIVYFPINYKVGKHEVKTYIESEDGQSFWIAYNTVKIKSTIPTKALTKYVTQKNKKFKIKFLDTKGKPLKNKVVKITVKGKTYKKRTNSKGIAKIKINAFKIGKHKITAYNPVSKEKRKITVRILKKVHGKTVTLKLRIDDSRYASKKLKTGDVLLGVANSYTRQHAKGISIGTMIDAGQEFQHSTRLLQAKIWFKNEYTGKIKTKIVGTSHKGYNIKHVKWIEDYVPYKAKVWYTYR